MPPGAALRGFARVTAFYNAKNLMRRGSGQEIPVSAIRSVPDIVSPDPMSAIEARDLLARVMASSPHAAHVVQLAARGLFGNDAARALGHLPTTHHKHVEKVRAALRDLGAEPAPKQPPRPGWKQRKRGR